MCIIYHPKFADCKHPDPRTTIEHKYCNKFKDELHRINDPTELRRPGLPFAPPDDCYKRHKDYLVPGFCDDCRRRRAALMSSSSRWGYQSGWRGGYGGYGPRGGGNRPPAYHWRPVQTTMSAAQRWQYWNPNRRVP